MKKILTMILLASLVIFTGCEDSSTKTATAEEQAAAEGISTVVYSAAAEAASAAFSTITPPEGASRASYIINSADVTTGMTGVTVSGSVEGSESSYSATFSVVFDNYTHSSDGTVINGTVTYNVSGSGDNSTISITGNLTVVYGGTSYDFDSYLSITVTSTTITMGGYVKINGAEATMSYTGAND